MFGYKPVLGLTDFPVTNIITNGDFVDGTNTWQGSKANISVSNNELTMLSTSEFASLRKAPGYYLSAYANRKYYISAQIKATSNRVNIFNIAHSGSGNYELMSQVYSRDTDLLDSPYVFQVIDNRISGFDNIYIKNCIMIDLTSTFEAGNEPTLTEMDEMLTYFSNSWFGGTVNLADYKWFMIYLLNQIRALKTAVVGLGGTV